MRRRRQGRWKTTVTVGLISKQLCTCSTLFRTFLCRCFARLQRETFRNFLLPTSFTFYRRNVARVLAHFFSLAHRALIFTIHLVAASISYFLTAATKFSCCSFNKISVSFVFYPPPPPLSLSLSFSLSLSLSPSLSLSFVEFHCVFSVPSHEIFPGIFSGNRRFSLPFLDLDECVQGSHDCLHLIDN